LRRVGRVLKLLCGPVFAIAGALHLMRPRMYEAIMPDYLPAHRPLVYASGLAEAAGGLALAVGGPRVRRWSMWWLLATLAAIFPANVHMAQHPERYPTIPGGRRALYARLPVQAVFAAWVVAAARR
jgi:uncharacterized membrane protein